MGGQRDQQTTNKPSWIKRLATFGERPAKGEAKEKVVYYSSDLFNAAMMVDATPHGADEPATERDEEAQR